MPFAPLTVGTKTGIAGNTNGLKEVGPFNASSRVIVREPLMANGSSETARWHSTVFNDQQVHTNLNELPAMHIR